jgi:hypothetical protein
MLYAWLCAVHSHGLCQRLHWTIIEIHVSMDGHSYPFYLIKCIHLQHMFGTLECRVHVHCLVFSWIKFSDPWEFDEIRVIEKHFGQPIQYFNCLLVFLISQWKVLYNDIFQNMTLGFFQFRVWHSYSYPHQAKKSWFKDCCRYLFWGVKWGETGKGSSRV